MPDDPDADTWWQHLHVYLAKSEYTVPNSESEATEEIENYCRYPDVA
ncbi:hypothetical protein IV498_18295 [Paenarthrobacter sp. Z7-10]|nr:hypothetical protein [Paenarthrobacter sp. Z7-10]MCZ2405054.1 hypothetical protein [Paenarthrobacter sp. Z7-10]